MDKEKICTALKTLPILNIKPMREFLKEKNQTANFENEVLLITFKTDLEEHKEFKDIKAVFKPVPPDDLGDAHAEIAAYKASVVLGFPEVPPTVMRKINNKIGSLQLYVEPALQVKESEFKKILQMASKEDAANLKLFYFVFGQWDTGAHNIIVSKNAGAKNIQLNAIDNSGIRNKQQVKYGELPFVRIAYSETLNTNDWHLPFPFQKVKIIENPEEQEISAYFRKHFSESIYARLMKIQKPIHYVIYQNSLWIQYHKNDQNFMLSQTDYYPPNTINKLKGLTKNELKRIFMDAKGCDFLTDAYLESILERRDQVIAAYGNSYPSTVRKRRNGEL